MVDYHNVRERRRRQYGIQCYVSFSNGTAPTIDDMSSDPLNWYKSVVLLIPQDDPKHPRLFMD